MDRHRKLWLPQNTPKYSLVIIMHQNLAKHLLVQCYQSKMYSNIENALEIKLQDLESFVCQPARP